MLELLAANFLLSMLLVPAIGSLLGFSHRSVGGTNKLVHANAYSVKQPVGLPANDADYTIPAAPAQQSMAG